MRYVSSMMALILALPTVGRGQNPDSVALVRRAGQLATWIGGAAIKLDTVFAQSFLAQAPAAQLTQVATQLGQLGRVTAIKMMNRPAPDVMTPQSALFQLTTDKGYAIPMTLVVDAAASNLVAGLLFASPTRAAGSIDDVLKELRELHGHASLFAARLDGSKLVPIIAEDTGRAMAIGSAFKLYVLAELTREIEQGQRHWADVVPIDSMSKSLPSGFLQTWPAGTPITVQTLATLMISQSDNTAADHLLHILGRANVESVQAPAGNAHATMNMPFLSTREMFVLKSPDRTAELRRYLSGSAAERRAVLVDPALVGRQRRGPDFSKGPIAIDSVEWFASTADLARVMVWLRDHSAAGPATATRGVLSVNKGIDWPAAQWRYVGFKGGSEPGVINLTFIAQRADQQWIVLVATWNDVARPVEEMIFPGLVGRVRDLLVSR